jgi:hypothetical protein
MFLQNIVSGKIRLGGRAGLSLDVGFDTRDSASNFKFLKLDFQNSEAVS